MKCPKFNPEMTEADVLRGADRILKFGDTFGDREFPSFAQTADTSNFTTRNT